MPSASLFSAAETTYGQPAYVDQTRHRAFLEEAKPTDSILTPAF